MKSRIILGSKIIERLIEFFFLFIKCTKLLIMKTKILVQIKIVFIFFKSYEVCLKATQMNENFNTIILRFIKFKVNIGKDLIICHAFIQVLSNYFYPKKKSFVTIIY
jgi:hypothetical protein